MHPRDWDYRRCRILYVQDSGPDRNLIEQMLRADEHNDVGFIGVSSTPEAMSEIYGSPRPVPNLILLGWQPQAHTDKVLNKLKSDPQLCLIPVVVLGSQMQARDIEHMYDEHASCVIPLPDTLPELERVFVIIKEFWLSKARLPIEAG
jgi:CheY-like chemotaxis protein